MGELGFIEKIGSAVNNAVQQGINLIPNDTARQVLGAVNTYGSGAGLLKVFGNPSQNSGKSRPAYKRRHRRHSHHYHHVHHRWYS